MRGINGAASARSLAMVVIGNCVTVNGILFDVVRARCADLGLAVGETVRVIGRTSVHIVLRTARGAVAMLERELAQFIVVGDATGTVTVREPEQPPLRSTSLSLV